MPRSMECSSARTGRSTSCASSSTVRPRNEPATPAPTRAERRNPGRSRSLFSSRRAKSLLRFSLRQRLGLEPLAALRGREDRDLGRRLERAQGALANARILIVAEAAQELLRHRWKRSCAAGDELAHVGHRIGSERLERGKGSLRQAQCGGDGRAAAYPGRAVRQPAVEMLGVGIQAQGGEERCGADAFVRVVRAPARPAGAPTSRPNGRRCAGACTGESRPSRVRVPPRPPGPPRQGAAPRAGCRRSLATARRSKSRSRTTPERTSCSEGVPAASSGHSSASSASSRKSSPSACSLAAQSSALRAPFGACAWRSWAVSSALRRSAWSRDRCTSASSERSSE